MPIPSKYMHILQAMKVGDVVYLPATSPRFDRQISAIGSRKDFRLSVENMVAVKQIPPSATHILKITKKHRP